MLYIQCNSTDPITHVICYFHNILYLNYLQRRAFVCFNHILNWPIRIKFLRPMSGHLVWQLLKEWLWHTVKLNTILQCILFLWKVLSFFNKNLHYAFLKESQCRFLLKNKIWQKDSITRFSTVAKTYFGQENSS